MSPQFLTNNEKAELLNAILNILDNEKTDEEILRNASVSLLNLIIHARSNFEFEVKFIFEKFNLFKKYFSQQIKPECLILFIFI